LTRHELKDQLQHDQFTDAVSGAVIYAQSHRQTLLRWSIAAATVIAIAGALWWYLSYQRSVREQDLSAALAVVDAQVGPPNDFSKTFSSDDAKQQASIKALSDVVNKDGGTREGLIAQYYLGTIKTARGDTKGAESDLKKVSDSSADVAPLAKIALAQLWMGEKRTAEAQALLRTIVDKPTDLVSKAQAQILLAQLDSTVNPRESREILKSVGSSDPAVKRAADALSAQLAK
jgi:predicted negative regulator of RcsB-dependent stress response